MNTDPGSASVDEVCVEDVEEVRRALEEVGLPAAVVRLRPAYEGDRVVRLSFGADPGSDAVGCLVVHTRASGESLVTSPSLPSTHAVPAPDFVDGADLLGPSAVVADAATNEEVVRVLRARDSLPPEVLAGLRHAARSLPDDDLLRRALAHPELAARTGVLAAEGVLEGVASGVPAEWALRRVLGLRS